MKPVPRMSRARRRRGRPFIRIAILLALIAVLAALTVKRFDVIGRLKPSPPDEIKTVANLPAVCDSLIRECCRSFGLSGGVQTELGGEYVSLPYRTFRQPWPAELPLIHFAERLSRMAAKSEIHCDCHESEKNGFLECALNSNGRTGGKVVVTASSQTKLAGREIAFILEDIESAPKGDLIKLIKGGYTFGYLAPPAYSLPKELGKLMSKASAIEILVLPSSDDGWADYARATSRQRSGRSRKSSNAVVIERAFDSHKQALSLCLAPADGKSSPETIKGVLKEAHRRNMSYLAFGGSLVADSLADIEGIKTIRLRLNRDLDRNTFSEYKLELLRQMILPQGDWHQIILADCDKIETDNMLAFKVLVDRLGIKIRPWTKLVE